MVGALLSSLTIAREWERGSMEQLISTPVTPLEILLGKLLPYFVIGLFETALCAAIGVWWFEVPFRGTLATLFVTSALFLIATLGVGFWFSVATKNQLMASQLALMATLLPSSLLSGFTFPIEKLAVVTEEEIFGQYTPGAGFRVAKTELGDLNIRVFTYLRCLNQSGLDPTYTNAFGRTSNVQQREDLQLNKVQITTFGWILSPKLRYVACVWSANTRLGQLSQVVVAGNLTYTFNPHLMFGEGILIVDVRYRMTSTDAGVKYRGFALEG